MSILMVVSREHPYMQSQERGLFCHMSDTGPLVKKLMAEQEEIIRQKTTDLDIAGEWREYTPRMTQSGSFTFVWGTEWHPTKFEHLARYKDMGPKISIWRGTVQ